MKYFRKEIIIFILVFIISFFLVSDLFINKGQPATFDGPTHLANIAMFYKSLKQGEFPVTWTDGFANYGMPLGLMAQQTTSYLGAFINFFTKNVLFSYNLVFLIGAFFSSLFFYWFLRLYFSEKASFIGVFLFNFAPYRIINIYIRGALPEFFASVFLPLILIGIYLFLNKKDYWGLILISISSALLILTHPFTLVIYSFIYIPYIILNLIGKKNILKSIILLSSSFVFGILLTGYYIIPLKFEIKYFYYGLGKNHLKPNQFLSLINYIDPKWFYFFKNDVFVRGHFIKSGLLETIIVIFGLFLLIKKKFYENIKKFNLLLFAVFCSLLVVLFTIPFIEFLYKKINILGSIQHPWRMMSAFIFLPPMILAYLIRKTEKNFYFYILIIIIAFLRFPQLYGKNYTFHPDKSYFFTRINLHGNILNTVWTGPTQDYPVKRQKGAIIEGQGQLKQIFYKDSKREYKIMAENKVRVADYTFFFPGWRVYVDKKLTDIQFQDPNYRGVITYNVPKGKHNIVVKFTNTKIRFIGSFITIFSLLILGSLIFTKKHAKK